MKPFYGWYVAATAVTLYFFSNGLAIVLPQSLAPRLMETFGATAAQVGRTTLITLTLAAFLAPFAGMLVDRAGVLRVLRTGLVVLVLCFAAYPFARSMTWLYVLHAGLAVGLALGGLLVNVVLLSRWFTLRRGLVVGALVAASSLAGATLPLAISPLVTDPAWGWRWGYGLIAAAFIVVGVLPGMTVLRERPADLGQHPDGREAEPAATARAGAIGVTLREAVRTRTLWCLALGSACLWFSIQAVTSQITIFLEREAHFAPLRATAIFSLIYTLSFCGKFIYGAISDWFAKRHVMLAAAITLLAGCILLFEAGAGGGFVITRDPGRLMAFATIFGLGFGGSFTMIQLTTIESFGQRDLGKVLGVVTLVDGIGGGLGPAVAGQLATSTGSYLAPFALVTGVAVVAVLNVLLIRPVGLQK